MARRELSRQAQAFESLLASDNEEEGTSRKSRRASSGKMSKKSPASGSSHTPGFRLKDAPAAGPDLAMPSSADQLSDLGPLLDLFGASFSTDIIRDVLAACGGSVEAAIEALLAMSTPYNNSSPAVTAPSQPLLRASPSQDTDPSPTGASPTDTKEPSLWNMLPQECKLLIFERLSLKDLSKAASTCKEFAEHLRAQRRTLRCVSVPTGLSMQAVKGLVAAFPAATAVDFSRWAKTLRFPHDFEAVAAAVATGGRWRAPGCSSPVESISLARCGEMTDGDVAAVCAALGSLRAIDLSRCAELGDSMLATLARYRRDSTIEDTDVLDNTTQDLLTDLGQDLQATSLESPAAAVARIAEVRTVETAARRSTAAAAAACGLEEIKLVGTGVTTRGVGELLRGSTRAPSLLTLDVSRCQKIAGDALVPGPNSLLRVLRASGCPAIRSVTLQLPSSSQLRELVLSDCKSLKDVTILSAPLLEELNLSGCAQLTSLSLRCPNLRRLRVSGCTRLHLWGGGAAGGGLDCPNLEEGNFFGCRSLDSAGIELVLPSLTAVQVLDFTGCVALSRLVAVQGAGLRQLKKLLVDGCAVLRQVSVAAPSLLEMSAKACPRLMVSYSYS